MKTLYILTICFVFSFLYADVANAQLSVNASATIGDCNDDGLINATVSGENLPINFELIALDGTLIRPSQSSSTFAEVPSGIYRIRATDAVGTVLSNAVEISDHLLPLTAKVDLDLLPCNGTLGSLEVQVNGGKGPYSYQIISGPQTRTLQPSNIFNNLPIGSYIIRIIDGCAVSVDVNADIFRATSSEIKPNGGQGHIALQTEFDCESGLGVKIRAGWKYKKNDAWLLSADANLYSWKVEYPANSGIFYGADGKIGGAWAPLSQLFIPLPSLNLIPLLSVNVVLRDACGTLRRFTTTLNNLLSLNPGNCSNDGLLRIEAEDISVTCLPVTHTLVNLTTLSISTHVQTSATLVIPGLTPLQTYAVTSVDAKGKILLTGLLVSIPTLSSGFNFAGISTPSECKTNTGKLLPDTSIFQSDKIIYTILQAPQGAGMTLPYTDTMMKGEHIQYMGSDELRAGNYKIYFVDSCKNGTVDVSVSGRQSQLEKIEVNATCTHISLNVKGQLVDFIDYELIILPGSTAGVGNVRDWLNSTTSLPFNNLPYGKYVIGLRVKGETCILDSLSIEFNTDQVLQIDTTNTGGYTCAGSATGGSLAVNMKSSLFPPLQYRHEQIPGSGNFTAWQSGNTFSGLNTGSYLIQVQDQCGNTDTFTAKIIDGALVQAGVNASLICSGDSLKLDVNAIGALSYLWSGPNGFSSTEKSPVIPVVGMLAQGLYSVVVQTLSCPDINAAVNVSISLEPLLIINLPILSVCLGVSADLTLPLITLGSSPGLIFSYFEDSAGTIPILNPSNIDSAGTYYIKATNGSGCSIIKPIKILHNILPIADITYGTQVFCLSGLIPVIQTGQGGGTYSGTPGLSINVNTGLINLGLSTAGRHLVIYTYTDGICTNTDTTEVNIGILPPIFSIDSSLCVGTTMNLSNPVLLGSWSSSNTSVATVHPVTGVVSALAPGKTTITYSLNLVLCLSVSEITLTVLALPDAEISYPGSPFCASGMATASINGQSGGVFSSTAGLSINSSTGAIDLDASTPGDYTITYVFGNGVCSDSTTADVSILPSPVASISYSSSPYCGTGFANVNQTGQAGGKYSGTEGLIVDSVSGTVNLSMSAAGTHVVIYNYSNGTCSATVYTMITILEAPGIGDINGPLFLCEGSTANYTNDSTGGIWSSSNPIVASINPAAGLVTGLTTGTTQIIYTITGVQCDAADTILLTVGTPVALGPITGASEGCSNSSIQLSHNIAGGIWKSSNTNIATVSNTGLLTGVSAGTVTITYVVGAVGCNDSVSKVVLIRTSPTANISYGNNLFCKTGSISVSQTGQTGGRYSAEMGLEIDSLSGTINLASSNAGSYTITYRFADEFCEGTSTFNITIQDDPVLNITDPSPYCGSADLRDTSIVSGSGSGLTYEYYSDASGNTMVSNPDSVTQSGTYYIVGISSAGCRSSIMPVNISILPLPEISAITGPSEVRTNNTAMLNNEYPGGIWSSSNTSILTVSSLGMITGVTEGTARITYTITGSNGCQATSFIDIKVSDSIEIVKVPNILTPNGDGKNDVLDIEGLKIGESASLEVFNRWGDMVYRSENYQNNWAAQNLNGGTYFYILKVNSPEGIKSYNGWVFVKR